MEKDNKSKSQIYKDGLHSVIFENSEVKSNLGEIIIVTTEDKIKLCLVEFLGKVASKREWLSPLGIFLTIILTFITADFKDWLVSKDTWRAIFIIAAVINFLWLIKTLKNIFISCTVEDIMYKIKESSLDKK